MDIPPVVLLALVAAVAAAGAALIIRQRLAVRRREALREAALGMGLEFVPELPALLAELGDLRIVSHGRSHELLNALRGARGDVAVVVADHRWVTGGGKNRRIHRATLAVLKRPGLMLPHVFMRPQIALVDAVGHMLGGQDINFPEDEAFSGAFVLQGKDEAATRALFGPSVRQQVLQLARDVRVEGRGDTLLVERQRAILPTDVMAFLDTAAALFEVLAAAAPGRW